MVNGHALLIVCDAGIPASFQLQHPGHHGHAGSNADTPCPFAMSAAVAPLPVLPDFSVPRFTPDLLLPAAGRAIVSDVPLRHTAPRGPPALV